MQHFNYVKCKPIQKERPYHIDFQPIFGLSDSEI